MYSTNYFGSIPYFQSIIEEEKVIIDLHENYKKQSWRNRTQILESNGPLYLSVPVNRPNGHKTPVKDILISEDTNWRKDHWKAIESSYQHAPYFFYYGSQIKGLIEERENLLYQFNFQILQQIMQWLDLDIPVAFTQKYIAPKKENDPRIQLGKKRWKREQERYIQVFSDKLPFYPNLSIIDLLMNKGPLARNYLQKIKS